MIPQLTLLFVYDCEIGDPLLVFKNVLNMAQKYFFCKQLSRQAI